ncbi:MAG: ABC transporter substrate-binding protein [Thermodesulfobacteriota bacterium]
MNQSIKASIILIIGIVFFFPSVSAFGKKKETDSEKAVLHILNWTEYIDIDSRIEWIPMADRSPLLRQFMRENNCRIEYHEYDSESEMLKKLLHNPGYYDIVIITSDLIPEFVRSGLLRALKGEQENILASVPEKIKKELKSGKHYFGVPYLTGITGIVFSTRHTGQKPSAWQDYFNPGPDGSVLAPDSAYNLFFAMQYLQLDPGQKDQNNIRKAASAFRRLIEEKKIKFSTSTRACEAVASGQATWGVAYSGDVLRKIRDGKDIDFIIPEEGTEYFIDTMVIPTDAPNPELAIAFTRFIQQPGTNAKLAEATLFTPANTRAQKILRGKLPEKYKKIMFPSRSEIMRSEIIKNTPDKYWRRWWRWAVKSYSGAGR